MKTLTYAKAKKYADKMFSLYIRQKYADKNGEVQCYTCTTKRHWKEMQCGHYVSRTHLATRWLEDNCRPQCAGCNMFNHGRLDVFALKLVKENPNNLEILNEAKHQQVKYKPHELVDLGNMYESMIQDLTQSNG